MKKLLIKKIEKQNIKDFIKFLIMDKENQLVALKIQPSIKETNLDNIKLETYSDKSFVVRGEETKLFTLQLQSLGGRWNPSLTGGKGWIFSNKKIQEVGNWLDDIKRGAIQPDDQATVKKSREEKYKKKISPINSNDQLVQWIVFLPRMGMKAILKVDQITVEYEIAKIEQHNNIVDTVHINPIGHKDQISKLVICNGNWQVWGFANEHTVIFNS